MLDEWNGAAQRPSREIIPRSQIVNGPWKRFVFQVVGPISRSLLFFALVLTLRALCSC